MDISKNDIELCLRERDYRKFAEFCCDKGLQLVLDTEDSDYLYLENKDGEQTERIFFNIDPFTLLDQFLSLMYDYMWLKNGQKDGKKNSKKKSI